MCIQPFLTTDGHFVQLRMSGCLGGINFVSSSIVLKSLTSQFAWDPLGQSAETHRNMIFWFYFADVTDFQSGCPWAQACGYSFFHNFYILNFQVPNQVRNIRSQRWQEDAIEMFTPTMGSMIAQSLNPFQIPAGIVS